MAALTIASWGVFGVFAQGLAQGLRNKPLNYQPAGYAIAGLAFAAIGYGLDSVREKQHEMINARVGTLTRERLERGVDFSRE